MKLVFSLLCMVALGLNIMAQQKPLFDIKIEKENNSKTTLEEVQQLILDNYYFDGIKKSDLEWAAIQGILRHISPPESPELAHLWTDEEYDKILNSLKGVKVTMGFKSTFNSNDGSLTINSFTRGSEAEKKLKINDRIVRIDNEALLGKQIQEINSLLDGKLNQSSTLKIVRDIEVFDVTLVRDSLKVENLIISEIPNRQIALIELKKVTRGMANELKESIVELEGKGIKKLIIDLRNNTGGILNEGVNIAKLFMKKNDIVLRTQARSKGVSNYVASEDLFYNHQIVILINENTASSAEIIASALQDHQRATLIGKKSYGKGVIETTYTLQNNYRLKFITNAMYSPKGISWQSKGILPDYFVDQTQAAYKEVLGLDIANRVRNDLHISTALKLLN